MRSWLVMLLIWLSSLGSAAAQLPELEVDRAEVLRLGDLVQVIDSSLATSQPQDDWIEAMGPPESDADKWFISILTMQRCAGCERLKADWRTSPWLLALAHPTDPKQSWSHFNLYDKDDASQAFRFESLKVTSYPTILVQPPRSGRFGEPGTVVYQGVYQGDPEQLARAITAAIRQYVAKLRPAPTPVNETGIGQSAFDPPWNPVPKADPWAPAVNPQFPPYDPAIPPQPAPVPAPAPIPDTTPLSTFPWSAVLTMVAMGVSFPAAVAVVTWLILFIRAGRLAAGKPPLIDQTTLNTLLELLQRIASSASQRTTSGQ